MTVTLFGVVVGVMIVVAPLMMSATLRMIEEWMEERDDGE